MRRIKLLLVLLLLSLTWNTVVFADELPDLGEHSETLISPKMTKRLGKEFMKEVRSQMPLINDPIINDYIQHLGDHLASHAYHKRKNFHFFVVDDSSINAFAGPDAHIGINSGTITSTVAEGELAAVMAHEIAHVTQHHIERLIERAKTAQIAAIAGILASIIIGQTVSSTTNDPTIGQTAKGQVGGDLATGIAIASIGAATQHMISFTREHEIEADNIGMKILYASSFDPNAMPNVFARMQRLRYDYNNNLPRFLLTHPVTSDRIAEAKNRADQYPPPKTIRSEKTDTFELIRARTLALTIHNSPQAIKNLSTQLKNPAALKYSYALTLAQKLKYSEATAIVTNLQKEYPNEILFQMFAADLTTAQKQFDRSLNLLKTALTNHQDYYPLIIQYGQTLIAAKHAEEAGKFIRSKIRKYPDDPILYRLLAEAYAKNQQLADAYQAKAKAYALEDYHHQAAVLLHQALKIPKLNATDRAIIKARIDQIKEAEKNL